MFNMLNVTFKIFFYILYSIACLCYCLNTIIGCLLSSFSFFQCVYLEPFHSRWECQTLVAATRAAYMLTLLALDTGRVPIQMLLGSLQFEVTDVIARSKCTL